MKIRIARAVSCQELTPQNTLLPSLVLSRTFASLYKIHLFNPQIRQVVVRSLESSLSIFQENKPPDATCNLRLWGFQGGLPQSIQRRTTGEVTGYLRRNGWWKEIGEDLFQQFFSWELICKFEFMFFSNISILFDLKFWVTLQFCQN